MNNRQARALEDVVGGILLIGVLVAALIIAVGLALLVPPGTGKRVLLAQLLSEHEVLVEGLPTSLAAVLAGARDGRPVAVIFLGLLLLILTPVVRVLVAGIYFAVRGERRYALISALVLALLLLGFVLGAIA